MRFVTFLVFQGTSLHSHAIPESDEQIIDDRLKELSAKGQYDDTEFYAAITKLEPETDVPFFTNLANTYKGELPRGPVNKILYIIKDLYAEFNSYRFPSFGVVAQRMLIVFVTIAVVIVGSFCLDEIVRGLVRALYLFEAPQGVGILGTAKAFFSYIYLNSKNYLGNFHLQSIIRRQEYETMLRYKVKRFDAIWPRGPPITA